MSRLLWFYCIYFGNSIVFGWCDLRCDGWEGELFVCTSSTWEGVLDEILSILLCAVSLVLGLVSCAYFQFSVFSVQ